MTNKCRKVNHLKMYWLMFSSCSYPGPPGPGPGVFGLDDSSTSQNNRNIKNNDNVSNKNVVMSQNLIKTSQKRKISSKNSDENRKNNQNYNKNLNRRRMLLDSNLIWIFLGFIWLSSPTLVGCRNDNEPPILVSSCDFNRLERTLNRVASSQGPNRITTEINNKNNNNNNCTYVKLNYYDYVNDSSSYINNIKNYSDLSSTFPSSSFSSTTTTINSNSASNINYYSNTDNTDNFISDKEKKQSEIDRKIIDEFRLEAIKAQILSKLGLKSKPKVTHTVSRDVVLETIQRAKETYFNYDNNNNNLNNNNKNNYHQNAYDLYYISGDNSAKNNYNYDNNNYNNPEFDYKMTNDYYERQQYANYDQQTGYRTMYEQQPPPPRPFPDYDNNNGGEADDFYAKTSEIISFAGKGKLVNGQRLLEFSITTDDRSIMHQELRVRVATLWVKVNIRPGVSLSHNKNKFRRLHHDKKSLTLWVFRLIEPYDSYGGGYLNDKDFDRATDLIALQQIKMSQLGWQKIDLTAAISKWYSEGGNKKLRLLIDCSGCGDRFDVHIFDSEQHGTFNINRRNLNNKEMKSNHNNNDNSKSKKSKNQIDLHNQYNSVSSASKNLSRKRNSIPPNHYHTFSQIDSGSSNLKFNINNTNNKTTSSYKRQSTSSSNSNSEENRPFLVVHIDPNVIKRVRRRAVECNGALEGQCCKQRFYVSFKDIGWDDWILAPPGYYANYCRGDCGGIFRTPDTYSSYHAHFIEEYRKAEKLEGMQPCCAPTKFSSMSLIYYGPDEKIIKRDLPKMVVDECGCP